ncbi:MAG: DNA methyltransferase [Methylotenera sp.]
MEFTNNETRREHFLAILRERLKDPAFRKIEGFPIGTDEDILALSDPPFYTACPNPFIEDFIKYYGKPYDSLVPYNKEPFAADVSEGKNDPIYLAHSYHTKVPHKAIMRYILHYTQPGDVVFDGFCGTGMTGVAAQLCGDRSVVESLGYRVEADGNILVSELENGKTIWKPFSKLGMRRAILNDLSPAATFIARNYNTPVNVYAFEDEVKHILAEVEAECGWMYETKHTDGRVGKINYTVWSDVYICPECTGEIVFWNVAVDRSVEIVKEEFLCPHCSMTLTKRSMDRAWLSKLDSVTKKTLRQPKHVPVLINYSLNSKRFEKIPDNSDLQLISKIDNSNIPYWVPSDNVIDGKEIGRLHLLKIEHINQILPNRANWILGAFLARCKSSRLKLPITATLLNLSWMYRWRANGKGGTTSGTYYICATPQENNALNQLKSKIEDLKNATYSAGNILSSQDSGSLSISDNSLDYIFIDPPFGSNLMYSELSFLWEAWLKVKTNNKSEAIENSAQGKGVNEYRQLMTTCFMEAYRVLKPGRWMTVEFSNTQAAIWNAIQTALQEAGFVVANVSALDKKQGSFKAVTTNTAVKQDLVISAYKPNGGLEGRFAKAGGNEDSAWDFVRTHLKYLPSVKIKDGQLEYIAERDPRIIFDRLVAWFVRHNFPVPLSSQEFQAGLSQRFSDRDGMVFLPEQVTEYDRKRMQTSIAPQMELFIADERSAIDWLNEYLKKKPSTYQEIHPEFISQLGAGWKKHEAKPELSQLLEGNFLCYDSKTMYGHEVPSQIHSYLSTNWSEYRNLDKSHPHLKAKATDRWYVPDPNKAQELEKLREKSLLKEFEIYKSSTLRKLKEFRLEAVRAGFKSCWGNRDYATIMAVAKKIPDDVLQEDEKLLLWYDQAVTRTEDNI